GGCPSDGGVGCSTTCGVRTSSGTERSSRSWASAGRTKRAPRPSAARLTYEAREIDVGCQSRAPAFRIRDRADADNWEPTPLASRLEPTSRDRERFHMADDVVRVSGPIT